MRTIVSSGIMLAVLLAAEEFFLLASVLAFRGGRFVLAAMAAALVAAAVIGTARFAADTLVFLKWEGVRVRTPRWLDYRLCR